MRKLLLKILVCVMAVCTILCTCVACGRDEDSVEEVFSEGLTYELNDAETGYTATGIGTFTGAELIFPKNYNNLPVIAIAKDSFRYLDGIKSIVIPNSVKSIGVGAFEACKGLTSVIMPDGLTNIEDWVFASCISLTAINIPSSVTSIGGSAFHGCTALTSLVIPASVTSIGGSAFYGCSSLTNVTIGEGVVDIGVSAFDGCDSLVSVQFVNTNGWRVSQSSDMSSYTVLLSENLSKSSADAVTYILSTYRYYYWKRY